MPQDLVLELLRHINNAVPLDARQMPEEISELTFAQVCLLAELFELDESGKEPLSLSVLAQKTGFSKATVCATLKKLREKGYVHMHLDRSDNRRKEITLTGRARQVEARVKQFISALAQALCAGVSQKDLRTTEKSLRVILKNAKGAKEQIF